MEIDSDASVCAHCQRDLILYSPIARRCSRTERGFDALSKSLGEVDFGPASAIVGSVVLAFLFDYISWSAFASGWIGVLFESLAVLAPFFAAIVLGRFSGRTGTKACSFVGIIAGIGGFAAHIMVWAFGALQSEYNQCIDFMNHVTNENCRATSLFPTHRYISLITYPAAGALLFVSGHAFGRMLAPSPFQRWTAEGDLASRAGQDQTLKRGLVAAMGVLTAVLPKAIDYLIELKHASNLPGVGH
jgi:hypothetical protein